MATSDLRDFARDLRRTKRRLERDAKQTTSRVSDDMVYGVKRRIIDNDAVASTELFRSVTSYPHSQPSVNGPVLRGRRVEVADEKGALVAFGTGSRGMSLPRLARRTYGRNRFRAGNPSAGDIMHWLKIKPSLSLPPEWPLAQAIASKIQKQGTEEQPFFLHPWDLTKESYKAGLRRDLTQRVIQL